MCFCFKGQREREVFWLSFGRCILISLRLQFKWAMGKCVFNCKWLSDAKFSWVKEFKGDKHKAMCCACNKVIDIERMGESALKSHMKGKKHKGNTCATSGSTQSLLMSTFLHKEVSSSCDQNFLFPHLRLKQMVNQQSSSQRDAKDVAGWRTLWQKMTCCLLKFCGHCKRYLLTIRTSQTRKWGKFSKLCFRIVWLHQSSHAGIRKLPISVCLAWQNTLKNYWWMKSKVLSRFYSMKV